MWDFTSFGPFKPSRFPGFLYKHFEQGEHNQELKFIIIDTYLVDEVCCLNRPAFRQIRSLDLNLLGEHHVTDLFAAPTNVRSAPEHKLIAHYTEGEVIDPI